MLVRNAIDIGLVIRERRRALKMDQRELARRVMVSRQWIIEIEKGKPRAEISLILRTLGALGLSLWLDAERQAGRPRPDDVETVDIDAILDDLARRR